MSSILKTNFLAHSSQTLLRAQPKRTPAEFQKIKSRSFANPFPENIVLQNESEFRIHTLVERCR